MRVLVDMDEVVAGWGLGYDRYAEEFGLAAEGGQPYGTLSTWNLKGKLTEAGIKIHDRIMELEGFYRDLPVIEGAQDAIANLMRSGHSVHFVSTPYLSNPTCASDKLAWVEEHFGKEMMRRTILATDKTLVNGDVLIDDRPEILGEAIPTWKHLCFGTYGYCETTASERVKDWWEALNAVALFQWERDLTATKMV